MRSTVAKGSIFLMVWQIFFAILSGITASQNVSLQNAGLQTPSAYPRNCSRSPCQHPADLSDLLAIQCSHINLDDLMDFTFAERICSL